MQSITNQEQYQILIKGHLPESWSDWFDGVTLIPQPDGITVITGAFPDQAALFGLLWRIRDLGLPLISVHKTKEKNYE